MDAQTLILHDYAGAAADRLPNWTATPSHGKHRIDLERAFGHTIPGIYAEVAEGGEIRVSDMLAVGEQRFGA
jgi:hypothetical protein